MPVFSLAQKPLGLTSSVLPPSAVTGLGLSASYVSVPYQVTASWTIPTGTAHVNVLVDWSTDGGSTWPTTQTLAAGTTSTSFGVNGNVNTRARVRLVNAAGLSSTNTTSSTLLTIPNVVTGVSVTNTATPGSVSIAWTNPASGNTGIKINRLGGTSNTTITTTTTSPYTDAPGSSYDVTYEVIATNASGDSAKVSGTVRTQPKPTTTSGWSAANPGNLNLTWNTSAQNANLAGYDVSLNDGGATQLSNVTSYQWTGATHGSSYYAKVRTRDSFGQVSAWSANTSSVTAINDTTGPTVPTPSPVWNDGIAGFVISYGAFSDSQSAVHDRTLYRSFDGVNWTSIAYSSYVGGTITAGGGSVNDVFGTSNRGVTVYYYMRGVDTYGNATNSPTVTVTSKPYGTFNVGCSETKTWKTAGTPAWRTDTQAVISGYFDAANSTQHGFWFYGNDVSNTCKGYTPDTLRIFYQREGSLGVSGNVYLVAHPLTTSSGNSYSTLGGLGDIDTGLSVVGSDVSGWYTITNSGIKSFLGSGTGKGIASIDPGGPRRLRGINTQAYSGALELTFN